MIFSSSDVVLIDTSLSHVYTIGANEVFRFASILQLNPIEGPLPPTLANCNAAGLFSSFIHDPFSTSVNGNDRQAANIVSGRWLQIPDEREGRKSARTKGGGNGIPTADGNWTCH